MKTAMVPTSDELMLAIKEFKKWDEAILRLSTEKQKIKLNAKEAEERKQTIYQQTKNLESRILDNVTKRLLDPNTPDLRATLQPKIEALKEESVSLQQMIDAVSYELAIRDKAISEANNQRDQKRKAIGHALVAQLIKDEQPAGLESFLRRLWAASQITHIGCSLLYVLSGVARVDFETSELHETQKEMEQEFALPAL